MKYCLFVLYAIQNCLLYLFVTVFVFLNYICIDMNELLIINLNLYGKIMLNFLTGTFIYTHFV